MNFLDCSRSSIARQISGSLGVPFETALDGVDLGKKGCDLTVALPRFRLKEKPATLAQKLVSEFKADDYVESIDADGIFVHYRCHTGNLIRSSLDDIFKLSQPTDSRPHGSYGTNESGRGRKIVVEFSSPNIAKPFHAGHLRSTIIGTFVSNLFEANGWEVVRLNYLGDWGKQFGLLAVGYERYGSETELADNAIMHLYNVYVAINKDVGKEIEASADGRSATDEKAKQLFRDMEQGDEQVLVLWRRFRSLSIQAYEKVYKRLNVHFDVYSGESLVRSEVIDDAMATLKAKNLLTTKSAQESRGDRAAEGESVTTESDSAVAHAIAVDLSEWKMGKPVVQKGDGATIYIMRDIAGAIQRYDQYHFDKMIYVVGDQQDLHVAQFFKILSLMGTPFVDQLEHVNFGKIHGMSTRKGEVKFLEDILDASRDAMLAQMMKNEEKAKEISDPSYTSDQVGMTCVKIQDMQAKRVHSYHFDLDRMTSYEGDTGAYLQYAHVRLSSIPRKAAPALVLRSDPALIDTSLLTEPKARELVFLLAIYPDIVKTALKNYEPSTIVSYCFRISHVVSSAWETLIVIGQEEEIAQARLLLFTCARFVLASAMRLLSLTPIDRM
ncbi:arginyl-tRNA synthetase [Lyophyllum atratum]|nr:arginyl-tRNA synthetase [Lyophyllum atratum]